MIAHGAHEKEFYCFAPAPPGVYIVQLMELIKVRENEREKWVPQIKERLWHVVHFIGALEVNLIKPQTLVDFSSQLPGPVRTIEVPAGVQKFDLLSLELARKIGPRSMEIVVLPGTTYGMALGGLVRTKYDYEPYWKRYYQVKFLELVRTELLRRLVLQTMNEIEAST